MDGFYLGTLVYLGQRAAEASPGDRMGSKIEEQKLKTHFSMFGHFGCLDSCGDPVIQISVFSPEAPVFDKVL